MKNCKDCFCINIKIHEYTEQIIYECEVAQKGVGNLDYIPEWCPLKKGEDDETNMA